MKISNRVVPICMLLVLLCFAALPVAADQGKDLYAAHCASCHTIGGGDSGGPDLKGVTGKRSAAWLERVISEPEKLTAEKDTVQLALIKQYGFEMPNLGLSRDDSRKIVAFLQGGGASVAKEHGDKEMKKPVDSPAGTTGEQGKEMTAPGADASRQVAMVVTPELIATGKDLFSGKRRFTKGGAPCSACHALNYPGVQGGNLAADLSFIYTGLGEAGMKGVLKALKFPTMKKIYADKPLTDEEIAALIAFARDAAKKKVPSAGNGALTGGVLVFAASIIALTLYKRRIG